MADSVPEDWLRSRLTWALRWLAADPDAAISALRFSDGTGRVPPCEIAHTLDDVWIPVRDHRLVEGPLFDLLAEIDAAWAPIVGPNHPDDNCTDEAMHSHPAWLAQRERARRALALLGARRDDANLFGNV